MKNKKNRYARVCIVRARRNADGTSSIRMRNILLLLKILDLIDWRNDKFVRFEW